MLLEPAIYFLTLALFDDLVILTAAESFADFDCRKLQIISRNALTKHLRIVHREMRNDLLHGRRRCSRHKRRDHRTGLQRRDQLRERQIFLSKAGSLLDDAVSLIDSDSSDLSLAQGGFHRLVLRHLRHQIEQAQCTIHDLTEYRPTLFAIRRAVDGCCGYVAFAEQANLIEL